MPRFGVGPSSHSPPTSPRHRPPHISMDLQRPLLSDRCFTSCEATDDNKGKSQPKERCLSEYARRPPVPPPVLGGTASNRRPSSNVFRTQSLPIQNNQQPELKGSWPFRVSPNASVSAAAQEEAERLSRRLSSASVDSCDASLEEGGASSPSTSGPRPGAATASDARLWGSRSEAGPASNALPKPSRRGGGGGSAGGSRSQCIANDPPGNSRELCGVRVALLILGLAWFDKHLASDRRSRAVACASLSAPVLLAATVPAYTLLFERLEATDVIWDNDGKLFHLGLIFRLFSFVVSYAFIARCLARHGLSGALYLDSISVLATDPRHSSSLVLLSYKSLLKRLGPAVVFIMLPFILLNLVQYWMYITTVPVTKGPAFDPERWGTEDGVLLVRYLAMSLSRTYLDAVFFFVSCVFCLICSLHIIKLRHYFKLLQENLRPPTMHDMHSETNAHMLGPGLCLQELIRLKEGLVSMSHRFRYYLTFTCVLVLTELVLTTYWLLAEWGGRAEALKRTLGSLCACTATHLFGCFLCIRFATIITHRCQTCVTLAMQLHAALTCESHSCTLPPSQASSPTALGPTVPPPRSFSMEEDKNDNGSTSPPQQTSVGHRARHPPWAAPMATRTSLPANFHISSFDVGGANAGDDACVKCTASPSAEAWTLQRQPSLSLASLQSVPEVLESSHEEQHLHISSEGGAGQGGNGFSGTSQLVLGGNLDLQPAVDSEVENSSGFCMEGSDIGSDGSDAGACRREVSMNSLTSQSPTASQGMRHGFGSSSSLLAVLKYSNMDGLVSSPPEVLRSLDSHALRSFVSSGLACFQIFIQKSPEIRVVGGREQSQFQRGRRGSFAFMPAALDTKEDQASKNPACPESRASSSSTGSSVKFETHIGTDNISTPHLPPRHSSPCPAPQQASLSSPPMSGIVGVQMPPYSTRANSYRVQSPANLVVPDLRMSERAPLPYAGSFPGHLPSPVDQFYQGQMWAYCQRTALLQYMQTANLGLSLFGFTLDRRFLQSLQTIVCSVFVFAIGRAMAKD